ncbi:MAG: ribonuclease P protein component [Pseudomonadota bacterium]
MGNSTFTRADRVYQKQDYAAAYRSGKRIETGNFAVIIRSNGHGRPRMGLSVSKRIAGAVKRNRIKRLVREFFRLHKSCFSTSNDYIFSVRRLPLSLNYQDIERELKDLFVKTC